ncbi:MAG: winged-helix domain-containing protein [Ruthenibacterium lactatiformans]
MAAQYQNKVSLPVIKRLPKYYRYISDMHNNGIVKVSSSELARMMGTTASQVRQDFNCFGGFDQQGIGYHVDVLLSEISKLLFSERISTQCSSVQAVWAAPYPAIFPPRPGAIT